MGRNIKDITGQLFGRLTVIGWSGSRASDGAILWNVSCACGRSTMVRASALRAGYSRSCGCLNAEKRAAGAAIFAQTKTAECTGCRRLFTTRRMGHSVTRCLDCRKLELHKIRKCGFCGAEFARVNARVFCSTTCGINAGARAAGDRRIAARIASGCRKCGGRITRYEQICRSCFKDHRSATSATRQARQKGATGVLPPLYAVFALAGGVCQICFKEVSRLVHWPDPLSASRDHIIPIVHGGTNDAMNIQLAHLGCNSRKQDRIGWSPAGDP